MTDLLAPLQSDFMRTAYIAGAIVGLIAPMVGLFLVERRMSLVGDGIGHVAFLGVGVGLVAHFDPVLVALGAAVLGAVAIELLRASKRVAGDQALALLFYVGIAAGVVLASMAGGLDANLFAYLFGSILTVDAQDLRYVIGLGVVDLVIIVAWYRALIGVAIDEEGAQVCGVPVRHFNLLIAILAGVTVGISMRTVGILLVSALMVLPVMTASRLAWSLRSTMWIAAAAGVLSAVLGLTAAYLGNLAPGGTIVLCAALLFLIAGSIGSLRRVAT
jgi:zinc transport system permease protein